MRPPTHPLALEYIVLVFGVVFFAIVTAEEECLTGKTYWCYECSSLSDPRCRDPFNWTALSSDLPRKEQCEGCCVKIVTKAHTPHEVVQRTCTKNIVINLFMVDHVCMYEGGRTGHMCFCEGDACNASPKSVRPPSYFAILLLLLACAFDACHLVANAQL